MSASTVLSAIAPVQGAAPTSTSRAGEDDASAFAAMVTDAGQGEAGTTSAAATPDASAPRPSDDSAPRRTPHAAPVMSDAAPMDAMSDVSAETLDLASSVTPGPTSDQADVPADAAAEPTADADVAPDVQPESPVVAAPVAPVPVPVPVAAAPAANVSAAGDVPAVPPPAAPVEAAQDAASDLPPPTLDLAAAQPSKGEPVRLASAAGEAVEPAASLAASAKTEPGATAASPAAPSPAEPASPAPAKAAPQPAAADLSAPSRLEPSAPNAPVDGPPVAPSADAAAPPPAVTASALSRATIETTVQIAARIVRQLEGKQTRFDMVLTPEDLGRVEVSLDIDADGQLAARLAFDNPAAAADLRGRADELRRQLTDAGFQLAQDAFEFSERGSNPFSGGGFERGQNRAASFAGGRRLGDQADQALAARPAAWINLSLTPDRVDMRV